MTGHNPHEPMPPSMAMIRIGGRDYPMRTSRRCYTCRSPHRQFIENELLMGRSYAAIVRQLEPMQHGEFPHPTVLSLSNHVKDGHLPQPIQTRRRIVEKRAEELGAAVAGEDDLMDYIAVNDLVIQRGKERLLAGEIDPSMNELLNAIGMKHRIEATSQEGYDAEAYQQSMFIYFEEAQRAMGQEQWAAFAEALSRNPLLKALITRQQERQTVMGEVQEPVPVGDE